MPRLHGGRTDFIGESTLAKQDELSSTEKLLELIRDEGPSSPQTYPAGAPRPAGQSITTFLSNSLSFTKTAMSVGVDLGHEDLKLVKVNRVSDRKIELVDFTRVALKPEIPRDHADFHQFLRATLIKFCGSEKSIEMWGAIPSARVETRHLRIPKVPPKQIANTVPPLTCTTLCFPIAIGPMCFSSSERPRPPAAQCSRSAAGPAEFSFPPPAPALR